MWLPIRERWALFRSYMSRMFDNICDRMNNSRLDNHCAFADQVDHIEVQTTCWGKVELTSEHDLWKGSDDLEANSALRSLHQSNPENFHQVRPVNWDELLIKDGDDENWGDTGAPSGGRGRHGDGNDNDDGAGEVDTNGGEKEMGKGMDKMDAKKGKAIENG